MSPYFLSLILGIVEGLTEFLPISSTAHLRLCEQWMGVDLKNDYWKMYSVVIQLGAILSVLVLYGQRLIAYAKTFPKGTSGDRSALTHPLSLVLIASITTIVPAYFLTKVISDKLESLIVIGTALVVGGIVMWVVDFAFRKPNVDSVEKMSPLDAIWIGAVQIISAVFPGTSRSMSTIAAGQVFGLTRSAALDFSFLVSLPVMFAACGYSFLKSLKEFRHNPQFIPQNFGANPWLVLAIGFIVSFIVALIVNRWFINWVKRRGFTPFAIYRVLLGVLVLALALK